MIEKLKKLRDTCSAILLLMVVACESAVVWAQDTKTAGFGFVDGSAATLSPDGSGRFRLDLQIKNSGAQEGSPSFALRSDMDGKCNHGAIIAPEPNKPIKPNAVAMVHATISGISPPATCYVALTTEGQGDTSLKQVKLTQQYLTPTMLHSLYACVALSMLIAFAAWGAAGIRLGAVSPFYKLGSPAWDFTKSWTSTTTLASAIIATALTLSALPELTKYASKSGYTALAMLISLAVVVAPFVFVAFRTGEIVRDPKTGQETVDYRGCQLLFLVSSAITLFAGLAQIAVLFLLLDEIFLEYDFWSFSSNRDPWLALNVGSIAASALVVALCWYVAQSMFLTIKLQKEADKIPVAGGPDETSLRERDRVTKTNESVAPITRPRLTWPVL